MSTPSQTNTPPTRESLYQPEQPGLIFPEMPTFNSPAEEREHRKRQLVVACRAFAEHGFGFGFGGHLTVRDPQFPDTYWTNPMAVPFSQVRLSNLVRVNHDGQTVEGRHTINRAGFVFHAAVHRAVPDLVAMCHAHTLNGTAWSSFGRLLDPINQDACRFFEDQTLITTDAGAVGVERKTGEALAAQIGKTNCVIHQNHGLFTLSRHSIDDAAFRFIALDRCADVQLKVEATGKPVKPVSPEAARFTFKHLGSSYISWLDFQTIQQEIEARNPDMFD